MHLSLTFNDRRRESVKLNVEFWINNESLALSYVALIVMRFYKILISFPTLSMDSPNRTGFLNVQLHICLQTEKLQNFAVV